MARALINIPANLNGDTLSALSISCQPDYQLSRSSDHLDLLPGHPVVNPSSSSQQSSMVSCGSGFGWPFLVQPVLWLYPVQ